LFRDSDGNGVMDFAPTTVPVKKGRWTSELNFIGFQAFDGREAPDVPEKAHLRVTIQWREPHDPAYYRTDEDLYLEPVVNLNLLLLRQRDPSGDRLATDDLEVVARTTTRAIRIQKTPTAGVYEQTIDFTTSIAGRYALRVEGFVPRTTKPVGVATLVNQERDFAIRPRIFVDVLNEEARSYGRPVFLDYASDTDTWPQGELPRYPDLAPEYGGVGAPADARSVISMGSAGRDGKREPFSAVGAGPDISLLIKPEMLMFDSLDLGADAKVGGSSPATGFSAGMAACVIQAGAPAIPRHFLVVLKQKPGSVMKVPDAFLKR
jgi:hypothetical protein